MTQSATEPPTPEGEAVFAETVAPFAEILRHGIWQPGRAAQSAEWPAALEPRVVRQAATLGIRAPWTHQAEAMETLLRGQDAVLASPTASGKSLAYLAVALHHLCRDPQARVIYVAPTKALARDQWAAAQPWCEGLGMPEVAAAYDGDTPRAHRAHIRATARMIVTNPEMLHRSLLPHHLQWAPWLGHLRLMVIDEVHVLRGVFGAHVAQVGRRLERLCRRYADPGAAPFTVFAASATIGNPREHASRLLGRTLRLVNADGAPRPARWVGLGQPDWEDPGLGIRRPLSEETRRVVCHLREAGLRVLVFVRSRRAAEALVRELRRDLGPDGGEPGGAPRVRVYRAGLLPDRRRAVEDGLRQGTLDVVVSTSALELGVDPGPLDACVLSGYPGTVAGFWQQAGRAGRRDRPALVVYLAGGGSLERYLLAHPEPLLRGDVEHAHTDPDNPLIQLEHLRCAAYEQPLDGSEAEPALLEALVRRGELRHEGGRWHWIGLDAPAAEVSLRRALGGTVRVEIRSEGAKRGRPLDQVEREDAPARIHPGALHLHDGHAFRVTDLDLEAGRAWVVPGEDDRVTIPREDVEVDFHTVREERAAAGVMLAHGLFTVTRRVEAFREVHRETGELLQEVLLDLPETSLETAGVQTTLNRDVVRRLQERGWWRSSPRSGSRGPDWASQRTRARERDEYRCRHCGAPESKTRQHDVHHRRPFRTFGWVAGVNVTYRDANRLENLLTLCPTCHRKAETAQQTLGLLQRGGHVLRNLATLTLMCDAGDLSLRAEEPDPQGEGGGWTVVERTPAGVGFGEALYHRHEELVERAAAVVTGCDCTMGCPACVGPPDEYLADAREACAALFGALGATVEGP